MSGANPFSATGQPSSGGVPGPTASFGQWMGNQQKIGNAAAFANLGPSTGETQADAGANALTAQIEAQASDAIAAAQAGLQNRAQAAAKSNLSSVGNLGGNIFGSL